MIFAGKNARGFLAWAALVSMAGTGCLSMQNQATIDGGAASASAQPYVEAYVEYPGPLAKWSGPATFVLHVSAKDAGDAQISTMPALTAADSKGTGADLPKEAPTTAPRSREPASAPDKRLGSDEARAAIANLATALEGASPGFQGCMYPVRVRLVRADGALTEKQGCRSDRGWARAVSEAVSFFVSASARH